MKDINDITKPDRVNGTISVAVMVLDQFTQTGALPLPRLCTRVRAAELRHTERIAEFCPDRLGKPHEVAL